MAVGTKLSDIIIPEVFAPYVVQQTMENSAFFQSGIVANADVDLGENLTRGGNSINMPFWNDITGAPQILSDSTPLTVAKITTGSDVAVVHCLGNAWGANDLVKQLSGDDPMGAIADRVSAWWDREAMQPILISSLKGAFTSASMADNVYDISAATDDTANISGKTFLDASQKLGDAKDQIAAIAMHSATQTALAKQDLIVTQRDSDGRYLFDTFMGKRVIIADGMPTDTGVYTTYLFGAGAVGYAEGGVLKPVETDRDILAGDDILATRRAFVLHPRGIKWIGSAAGVSPSTTELETGTNWSRVYENKAIKIVQFIHKLAV